MSETGFLHDRFSGGKELERDRAGSYYFADLCNLDGI